MKGQHSAAYRPYPLLAALFSALLIVTAFAPAATAQTPEAATSPGTAFDIPDTEFIETDCPYVLPPGITEAEDFACGTVSVPLDYEDPDAGTAELLVIHIPSTSTDPADEPLVFLNGGPGSTSEMLLYLYAGSDIPVPLLDRQDIIIFDQRGVGESIPSLACTPSQDILGFPAACVRDHQEQGIDHAHFTVDSSAADVASLANAFDVAQVDLFGLSYGTFLGQVILRDHPDVVRSAVLHLPLPLESEFFADQYIGLDSALTTLFEQCEADESCPGTVESLEEDLQTVVDELGTGGGSIEVSGTNPITGESGGVLVTDVMFAGLLFSSLYSGNEISRLPELITMTADGDETALENMLARPGAPMQQEAFAGITMGAFYTTICQDVAPFTSYAETQDAIAEAGVRPAIVQSYVGWDSFVLSTCYAAGLEPSDQINNEPVISDIPSLIMTAEFDPITPPFNGEILAENLENSYLVDLPGLGHGWQPASEECMVPIMQEFLEDPSVEPDTSCTADMGLEFPGSGIEAPASETEATPDAAEPDEPEATPAG